MGAKSKKLKTAKEMKAVHLNHDSGNGSGNKKVTSITGHQKLAMRKAAKK